MERVIRVTGKGNISVKPDLIRLNLNLIEVCETYEEALEKSADETETLRNCLETLGFSKTDLKTISFRIDTRYEDYQDKDKVWKRRLAGYEFRHNLKVEFDMDNELLGKVLYELAHSLVKPELNIVHTVKNVEAAKNMLLGKAIEDSMVKAKVLAQAAGVELGEIVTIDYSWGDKAFEEVTMRRNVSMVLAQGECRAKSYNMDVEPEDINVSDTVMVVWKIK